MHWLCSLVVTGVLFAAATPAFAQNFSDPAPLVADKEDATPEGPNLDDAEGRKLRLDPAEDPNESYLFAGWMVRGMIMPKFLLKAFLGSSPRVADWSTGAEFTYRRDGFDIVTSVWWTGYRFQGPVRDKNDPIEDTEWINSNWSMLLTTVSFLWDTQFSDQWALQYGFDVGLGWLMGKMHRSEAYQGANGKFAPCAAAGVPATTTASGVPYCEAPMNPVAGSVPATDADNAKGAQYNVEQRRWTQGGNAPNLVPWLAARLSLRYKPIKQLMTRADLGLGLGVYLGLSAAYGF